ncbi:non-specific serine/threonine protein kinase [Malassezia brasiliensis]|uniref:non-specific serine/threonine protein kinase n=1 Tax=Malassezia brasiliensis TaxID=1821822 RepID=A0AAF0DSL1_9BASI|nr:non-specific serine/threonine protein kinase [Malassezia brasiliensis]
MAAPMPCADSADLEWPPASASTPNWHLDELGASGGAGAAPPINTVAGPTSYLQNAPPSRGSTPRIKHVVKPNNDTWIYRNGPGISSTRRSPLLIPVADDTQPDVPPPSAPAMARNASAPLARSSLAHDFSALALTSTGGAPPSAARRHISRPSSRTSYRSRRSETVRDASSIWSLNTELAPRGERSSTLHEDEAASMASGSSRTSLVRPAAVHPAPPVRVGSMVMTPAEAVRMEAQAGVARVPDNPGHTTEAEERGWRARTQQWVQELHTPRGSMAPALVTTADVSPTMVVDPTEVVSSHVGDRSRRDTSGSQLSDWTMDAQRMRGSDRSSISTLQPRSPSPYDQRAETTPLASPSAASLPGWSSRSPRTTLRALDHTGRGTPPLRSESSAGPLPSISVQMGHYGNVVSTTEVLNAGVPPSGAPGADPRLAVPARPAPGHDDPRGSSRRAPGRRRTPNDFVFGEVLGEGSYSTVLKAWDVHDLSSADRQALARRPSALEAVAGHDGAAQLPGGVSARAYAVKVLDKVHILKEKKQKYVRVEKEALSLLLHRPGIVTLYFTFQDRESLYFVLELAPNGEFLHYVKQLGTLDTTSATFYAAQLADAIHSIHRAGVVHRDIKPENMLLDAHMRILVTDFGSAKLVGHDPSSAEPVSPAGAPSTAPNAAPAPRSGSFVGTAEYVSPELLGEKAAGMPSDWWAFACVVFQMLAGHSPFKAANEYQTFQRILHRQFSYPAAFPAEARALIDRLLVLEPEARPDAEAIKHAPFFAQTNFATIWTCEPPPMRPGLAPRVAPNDARTYSEEMRALATTFETAPPQSSPPSSAPTRSASEVEASESTSDESAAPSGSDVRTAPAAPLRTGAQRTVHRPARQNPAFATEIYDELMLPNEMVSYSSPIVLRRTGAGGMFSKRCQLLLTSYPRLLCVRETSRALKVLCEIILRQLPPHDIQDGTADTLAPLQRTDSSHSMSRLPRSHSLRSQPSMQSMVVPSRNALSRGFSRKNSARTSTDALTRFASTGARAEQKPRFEALSTAGLAGTLLPRDTVAAPRTHTDPRFANWLLGVEVRSSRGFTVHTPARAYLFDDPAGDPQYWVQCIQEAEHHPILASAGIPNK